MNDAKKDNDNDNYDNDNYDRKAEKVEEEGRVDVDKLVKISSLTSEENRKMTAHEKKD